MDKNRDLNLPKILDIIKFSLDSGKIKLNSSDYRLYLTETEAGNFPTTKIVKIQTKFPRYDSKQHQELHSNKKNENGEILFESQYKILDYHLEAELARRNIRFRLIKFVGGQNYTSIYGLE